MNDFSSSARATREYEGLGVGLAIAKAVMEELGGSIRIVDAPKGCRVGLYLPGRTSKDPAYG